MTVVRAKSPGCADAELGRIFTFFVLMIGLGIVAVPSGLVASALSKVRQDEDEGRPENSRSAETP
jgi:voltage-gated potassium channel